MKFWVKNIDKYDIRQLYNMFLIREARMFTNVIVGCKDIIGYNDGSVIEVANLYPEIQSFLVKYNNIRN